MKDPKDCPKTDECSSTEKVQESQPKTDECSSTEKVQCVDKSIPTAPPKV
jgi:hypothetical protein